MTREEMATKIFIALIYQGMVDKIAVKQSIKMADMLINELNRDGLKSRTKADYYGPFHNGIMP